MGRGCRLCSIVGQASIRNACLHLILSTRHQVLPPAVRSSLLLICLKKAQEFAFLATIKGDLDGIMAPVAQCLLL